VAAFNFTLFVGNFVGKCFFTTCPQKIPGFKTPVLLTLYGGRGGFRTHGFYRVNYVKHFYLISLGLQMGVLMGFHVHALANNCLFIGQH
jgi:hypothetical protein